MAGDVILTISREQCSCCGVGELNEATTLRRHEAERQDPFSFCGPSFFTVVAEKLVQTLTTPDLLASASHRNSIRLRTAPHPVCVQGLSSLQWSDAVIASRPGQLISSSMGLAATVR